MVREASRDTWDTPTREDPHHRDEGETLRPQATSGPHTQTRPGSINIGRMEDVSMK